MMLPRPHRCQHLAAYLLIPPPKTSIGTPSSAVAPDKLASAESGSDDLTFVQKVVTKEKLWQESYISQFQLAAGSVCMSLHTRTLRARTNEMR
jgi:hypothetical protein